MYYSTSVISRPSSILLSIVFLLFSVEAIAQCTFNDFTFSPNDTICKGSTLQLTDQSQAVGGIASWQWFADGSQLPGGSPTSVFIPSQEGIYTIELLTFDAVGTQCPTVTHDIVVLGNPSVQLIPTEISCNGVCDGGLEIDMDSENTGAYTSLWAGVGGSGSLTNLCAGIYTVLISDAYGCTQPSIGLQYHLYEPDPLHAGETQNGSIFTACPNSGDIQIVLSASGGTPFPNQIYEYSWSPTNELNDPTSSNPTLTPSAGNMNQEYVATVTDSRGCETTVSIFLLATPSEVGGVVTIGSEPCVACEVRFYLPDAAAWDENLTSITDEWGAYYLDPVPGMRNFVLMVDPDNVFYPRGIQTYYNGANPTHLWDEALELSTGCGTFTQKDISVIQSPVHNGICTIKGKLSQLVGPGKMETEEDPIPLIDVVVEKTPPGSPQGRATTDENGEFEFNFLEWSDTIYTLYVNIPGLPMDPANIYEIMIEPGDVLVENIELCVDLDTTVISTCTYLGTEELNHDSHELSAFPNPNTGDFFISTGGFENQQLQVDIFDLTGRAVWTRSVASAPKRISISDIPNGYYVVRVNDGKKAESLPICVLHR